MNDFVYFKSLYQEYYLSNDNKTFSAIHKNNTKGLSFDKLLHSDKVLDLSEKQENDCVLIVEDDKILNTKMSQWLKKQKYSVISAHSFNETLDILTAITPQFIFIDIALEGQSGEDLVHYIHSIILPLYLLL